MALEFLAPPFKSTPKLDYMWGLRKYVEATFGPQVMDDHKAALESLVRLREDTRTVQDASESNLVQQTRYYNLFKSLSGRVPFTETDIRVQFRWGCALRGSRKTVAVYDSLLELVGYLWNIGCVAAGLGVASEDVKAASKAFQKAAGAFAECRKLCLDRAHAPFGMDLSSDSLDLMVSLMLAQAQECFYTVAQQGGKSHKVLALLAWGAQEFYASCAGAITKNTDMAKQLPRDWLKIIAARGELNEARGNFHSAEVLYEAKKYGESLSRLKRGMQLMSQKELSGEASLRDAISIRHTKIARENDNIYFERVPDYDTLPRESGKAMVKALPVEELGGDDPFRAMVPFAVHAQLQRFIEHRNMFLATEASNVEQQNQQMRESLQQMGLPGSLDAEDSSGSIPPGVKDGIQRVVAGGGWARIRELLVTKVELATEDRNVLAEAKKMLDEEEREDAAGRSRFHAAWQRTPSHSLTGEMREHIAKLEANLQQAEKSDALVEGKITAVGSDLEAMSSGNVERLLPRRAQQGTSNPLVPELRRCLFALDGIVNERQQLFHQLREQVSRDDVTSALMQAGGESMTHEGELFQQILTRYQPNLDRLRENAEKQKQQLQVIQDLNHKFQQSRTHDSSVSERQAVLQRLSTASLVFTELSQNLSEGVTFYLNLQEIVSRLKRRVQDWCYARRQEKAELEQLITQQQAAPPPQSSYAPQQSSNFYQPPPQYQAQQGGGAPPSGYHQPSAPPANSYSPYNQYRQ